MRAFVSAMSPERIPACLATALAEATCHDHHVERDVHPGPDVVARYRWSCGTAGGGHSPSAPPS